MVGRWWVVLGVLAAVTGGCGGKKPPRSAAAPLAERLLEGAIEPRLSADGSRMVYTRYQIGKEFLSEIMMYDSRTGRTSRITDDGFPDLHPDIGGDLNLIVYVSQRDKQRDLMMCAVQRNQFFAVTETGGEYPDIHPTMPVVVYSSNRANRDVKARDLWAMDLRSGNLRAVVSGPGDERMPRWSRDGRMLTYVSDQTGNDEIYVFEPATARTWQVTNLPSEERFPTFSPDMNFLVFSSDFDTEATPAPKTFDGPKVNLWCMDIRDFEHLGRPRMLFRNNLQGSQALHAEFHPDGKKLFFATNGAGLGQWEIVALNFPLLLKAEQAASGIQDPYSPVERPAK